MKQNRQFCFMGDTVWKPLNLYGRNGKRKYLNLAERGDFIETAKRQPLKKKAFCLVLAYTGCRISEGLRLNRERVDVADLALIFETLKQRKRGEFRAVPAPQELVELLLQLPNERFFDFSRPTAWRIVKEVMHEAGIEDSESFMPKALIPIRKRFELIGIV